MLTAAALAAIFPPHGLWPLTFVALVPWALATCRASRAWLVHWLSFLVGWGFFLFALRWLMPVTGLGCAALALYLALYWPLAGWAIRTGRRHGLSPLWTLPIVWVGCELLRARVMTGFPWLFLSHALAHQLPLVQIADLGGAYAVSFVAALINGVVVELLLQRYPSENAPRPPRVQLLVGATVTIVLLAAALTYGFVRLGQFDPAAAAAGGPRVAVVQHDFPLRSTPPYGEHEFVVLASYLALAAEAARERPDLIALPETVWNAQQNIDFLEQKALLSDISPTAQTWGRICHGAVAAFARSDYASVNRTLSELERQLRVRGQGGDSVVTLPRLPPEGGPPVTVLVGAVSVEQFPEATYPKIRHYNSALVYDPDGSQRRQRYDKIHLVPFGEFVPFRQTSFLGFDLHWLYRRLNELSPFSQNGRLEYSLTPGREYTRFALIAGDRTWRFGVPICYEDAAPYIARRFVWQDARRQADFLVNISNDGWFLHSNELPQHLAICALRAVENRISIARAVNTGISGFIDPNGRILGLVEKDGRTTGPGVVGWRIERLPLDQRDSVYGRHGDVFAVTCAGMTLVLWLVAVFERWLLAIQHRLRRVLARGGE